MGRTLDIYVFSPRPLNDLLIEPNMPKLTLVVKTKKCQLSINDEVYAAAEKIDMKLLIRSYLYCRVGIK